MGLDHPDPTKHGPGCLPGKAASKSEYNDPQGRIFTGHWVVEPGRRRITLASHRC